MLLPAKDAAAVLGVSITSVRRGLKSGRLKGQRQETPQGHIWLVEVPDDHAVAIRIAGYPDSRLPGQVSNDTPGAAQTVNLAQRAEDMAVYSHKLLAPYVEQIAAQAEEIGRLKAERDQARAQADSRVAGGWWRRLWGSPAAGE